jgi:hypothetical protein
VRGLLLAHDRSRQDFANAMRVSTGTVITHQSSIHTKLGVHSRAELLAALLPMPWSREKNRITWSSVKSVLAQSLSPCQAEASLQPVPPA